MRHAAYTQERCRTLQDREQMLEAIQTRDAPSPPPQIGEWVRLPSGRMSVRMGSGEVIEV